MNNRSKYLRKEMKKAGLTNVNARIINAGTPDEFAIGVGSAESVLRASEIGCKLDQLEGIEANNIKKSVVAYF